MLDSGTGQDADGRTFRFCVMEHVPGASLAVSLAQRGPYDAGELAALFVPILDALVFIHAQGVVHRDIKPTSIVTTPTGVPKLIDFGLAVEHADGQDSLTSIGTIVGTPAYMSPEQATGEPVGPQSDLFSLGVVIYQAATGVNPMNADSMPAMLMKIVTGVTTMPSTLRPGLPPAFDTFIARMLAPKPEKRFHDAASARDACALALQGPPGLVPQAKSGVRTAGEIRALVENSDERVSDETVGEPVLIFSSDTQQTWVVPTRDRLFLVLDDADTRRTGRLVQGALDRSDALPVRISTTRAGQAIVTFGRYAASWLYSPTLFRTEHDFTDALTRSR